MELDKLIEQYGNIDTFYYDEDGFLLYSCDDEDGIQQYRPCCFQKCMGFL